MHQKYLQLCRRCATQVYVNPVTTEKIERVTNMLYRTGCMESDFTTRRQKGITNPKVGGYSLWQLEYATIRNLCVKLQGSDTLMQRVHDACDIQTQNLIFLDFSFTSVLQHIQTEEGDDLACALCRVYYLGVPEIIPSAPEDQWLYWLQHYNCYGNLKHNTREQSLAEWMEKIK